MCKQTNRCQQIIGHNNYVYIILNVSWFISRTGSGSLSKSWGRQFCNITALHIPIRVISLGSSTSHSFLGTLSLVWLHTRTLVSDTSMVDTNNLVSLSSLSKTCVTILSMFKVMELMIMILSCSDGMFCMSAHKHSAMIYLPDLE